MMLKRAIAHIHTHHSFDCTVPPRKIVEKALKLHIDYLLITDHDSLAGSIEAAAYAKKKGYAIQIPVAAEYTTDVGDVIVAGVPPDFKRLPDHHLLCKQAKNQGGHVILPHPYKGHLLDKIDFSLVDCIEVYNARCTINENLQAFELAKRLGKPMVYGSDAHTLADLGNAIFAYGGITPLEGETFPARLLPTPWQHNEYSRLVRGVKLRRPKDLLRVIKRSLLHAFIPRSIRKDDE